MDGAPPEEFSPSPEHDGKTIRGKSLLYRARAKSWRWRGASTAAGHGGRPWWKNSCAKTPADSCPVLIN